MKMNPLSLIAAALFCQSAVAQNLPPADDFPNSPPGSPLVIGPAGAVTVTGILNSAEDLDVFSFDVGSNTVGTATTLTVYTTGDVDTNGVLRRVGDATNPIIASDEGGTGNFRIVKAVEPGKFSIQVGGKLSFNGAVNSYTLHVELTPGNPPGVPDIDVPEVPRGSTVAFGSITVNTSATRTITLRNTGTANLQVTGITIPGSANTPAGTVLPFRIEEGAARVIAPGATSNFRVIFKPLTAASFTGTVNIASNDPDENPWTFIVTGSGKPVEPPASPEIGVGLGGADLPSGGTVNFGVVPVPATAPVVKELVISNSGQGVLQLGAVTLSPVPTAGANGEELLPQPQPPAGFFRVLTQPASSIDPGRTTVLRLGAGGGDANAAAVVAPGRYMMLATIPNSDSDENPYRLLLTAEVQAPPNPGAPEIAVFAGDASLEDDGTLDLGSTHTGAPIEKTVTIKNTGDGQLNLTGISVVASGPVIAIFPPPPLPFRVEGAEPRIVLPGASTSCRVIFPATTAGAFQAMLVIQNNDADENPFSILLKASAEGDPVPPKEPEIAVSLDNADLPMGAAVDFGRTPLTVPVKKTITISNKGTATLNVRAGFLTALRGNLLNIPFRLAGEPFSSVAPGASKALSVVFQPVTAGKYEAMLIVTNNDKDENPYRLKLTGQGGTDPAAVPDIGLKLGDADLAMNALVDFGVAVPGSSVTKEIRILNSGAGELKLGRISFSAATAAGGAVNVPGADGALLPPVGALPFRALLPPNNVVPPGGSAVLRLVYMAPASGTQQVGLSIESNDPDESPWLLKLKGASSGTPPAPAEISVSAGGADLPIGGKLEFGDVVVGSPVRREITVTNSGTGELRITGFSILPAEATANNALLFLPPNALVRVVSGPGTIAPGKSAGYVLEMMGFTAGPADFNARISSNDADENPYTFKVTGVIVAPPNPGNGGEGDPASPAGAIGN